MCGTVKFTDISNKSIYSRHFRSRAFRGKWRVLLWNPCIGTVLSLDALDGGRDSAVVV